VPDLTPGRGRSTSLVPSMGQARSIHPDPSAAALKTY